MIVLGAMFISNAVEFYRQTYDGPLLDWPGGMTVHENVMDNDGCSQVVCADGCINGKYQEPDGSWHEHVECKGTGLMWVNLW